MAQQVNLSNTSGIVCAKCGNFTFVEAMIMRKVSRLLTGDKQDGIMPLVVFTCQRCGTVCPDALAPEVKELFEDETPFEEIPPVETGAKVVQMFPQP